MGLESNISACLSRLRIALSVCYSVVLLYLSVTSRKRKEPRDPRRPTNQRQTGLPQPSTQLLHEVVGVSVSAGSEAYYHFITAGMVVERKPCVRGRMRC